MQDNIKNILRWIAVLPSAIAGLFIGPILVNIWGQFQQWFIGFGSDGGYAKIIFWIVSSAVGGALSVYWGTAVAPTHKKIVAGFITALVFLYATIGFLSYYFNHIWFWPLLGSLAFIISSIYTAIAISEDENHPPAILE